ncbi:MAG: family 43 glycosylhydrolase [Acidobacteriota bacterium]|nr:family 43 glycosylhydrolase [Acidobacteriota bacterium]
MKNITPGLVICFLVLGTAAGLAQNPLTRNPFAADPAARVFQGRVCVYPSHDVNCGTEWFCMKDYMFSSENPVDWVDHGVVVDQEIVAWVDAKQNSMWAPDCYEKGGKYYFYFPAIAKGTSGAKGMTVGVAISDTPYGPLIPQEKSTEGVPGIDPNVFIDKGGHANLYWAGVDRGLLGAKLKANMLEIDWIQFE